MEQIISKQLVVNIFLINQDINRAISKGKFGKGPLTQPHPPGSSMDSEIASLYLPTHGPA